MKTIALHFMGRFGNQLFQYAFARGYAQRHGYTLETEPWVGQKIFEINDPPISQEWPKMEEQEVPEGKGDVSFLGYAQNQMCADFYTESDIRSWFRVRPEIEKLLSPPHSRVVAHYRAGDYIGAGYPVVSRKAISAAVEKAGYNPKYVTFVSDEFPTSVPCLPYQMGFFQDFYTMMQADILFRANSTFSWWAGALNRGTVYSPRIDGLLGGMEHDSVEFELGNHCKPADLFFITDIHLAL